MTQVKQIFRGMDSIDESKRKPRRTRGTPSYYYRNRFAAATIVVGTAIFGLWYMTPVFQKSNKKFIEAFLKESEESKERQFIFDFHAAPRTADSIRGTIKEADEVRKEI